MEVLYERDLTDAYMILPAEEDGDGTTDVGYQRRMILENSIRGFLTIQKRSSESGSAYYYRISSRVSLAEYLEHTSLSEMFLKQLIFTIYQAVTELGEYLLSEEFLLLDPETIFVREESQNPFVGTFLFCLFPDRRQDARESLRQLIKYLMEKTERTEDHCAVMCYELYGLLQKDNFCLKEFMDALERWSVPAQEKEPEKKKRPKQLFASRRNSGIIKLASR